MSDDHSSGGFGGLALSISLRSHSMPCACTFAHCASDRRTERMDSSSSGDFAGRPRERFSFSMR